MELNLYNDPIDIVIPWLNPDDEFWRADYDKYKAMETSKDVNDPDFNGACRYRDMGTIIYVLRSIEKNCSWVHKVFLILRDEHQIPAWLNVNNPKLEIVYHREYIPEELLPTFNSNVIENFLWRLDKLSNNYILCNDDTIFMKPTQGEKFFLFNKPVLTGNYKKLGKFPDGNLYWSMLNNNMTLEEKYNKIFNKPEIRYDHMHLMVPHQKYFEKMIWSENFDYLYLALSASRFRSSKNITHLLFNDLCIITGYCILIPNLYGHSMAINILDNFDYRYFDYMEFACINDTDNIKDYEKTKVQCLKYLNGKFPEKSSYEV